MRQKFPKVFIVILNFNGIDSLLSCLSSVFQSDYPNFEVVVVDNDSCDESFEKARIQFSRAHFIKNPTNVGFSKGNNIGIRYALEKFADFVFVLNNDTIIDKDALSSILKTFEENRDASIVSPLILTGDGETVWFAGGTIDWKKMRTNHIFCPQSSAPYASEYLTGCAMMIKKDVFKKIGLFDERFFLYYEDADFSLRAKKAGFDLLLNPSAKIIHFEHSNIKNNAKTYWLVLSGMIFFQTHASFAQKIWQSLYLSIRKMKNFYNLKFHPSATALEVRKAFVEFEESSSR